MQDELDQKVVTLSFTASKFTAKVFYQAIQYHQDKMSNPQGKQSVKSLKKKGQGLEMVDVEKAGLKEFKKAARKYQVDFSVTKEKGSKPPRYHIHFKGRDESAINSAMRESLGEVVRKSSKKPLMERLAEKKEKVKNFSEKAVKTIEKAITRGNAR